MRGGCSAPCLLTLFFFQSAKGKTGLRRDAGNSHCVGILSCINLPSPFVFNDSENDTYGIDACDVFAQKSSRKPSTRPQKMTFYSKIISIPSNCVYLTISCIQILSRVRCAIGASHYNKCWLPSMCQRKLISHARQQKRERSQAVYGQPSRINAGLSLITDHHKLVYETLRGSNQFLSPFSLPH